MSVVLRCPGCDAPMKLGEAWADLETPPCPDCDTEGGDEWAFEPRISESEAEELEE